MRDFVPSRERIIVIWGAVRCAAGMAAAALVLPALVLSAATPAWAQGRLDARYAVTLAGIPIGKGAWVIDLAEKQFTAAASGATSGLLRVFASGQGSGASRGHMVGGNPVPASFAASITSDRKTEEIRMTLASGSVRDFAINPPPQPDPERIPVTEAHRRGASDPMTASLFRVPGNGNPVGPQACQRVAPVFDGRIRYDLKFAYKRMEHVKAEKGYEGPAVVCSGRHRRARARPTPARPISPSSACSGTRLRHDRPAAALLAREVYNNRSSTRIGRRAVALITGEEKIKPPAALLGLHRRGDAARSRRRLRRHRRDPARRRSRARPRLHRPHAQSRGREETLLLGAATDAPMVEKLLPGANIVRARGCRS
jgi:hypothetical protein